MSDPSRRRAARRSHTPGDTSRPRRSIGLRTVFRLLQSHDHGVRRRTGVGAARIRSGAPLDDAGRVQRTVRAVPVPAWPQHREFFDHLWRTAARICRRRRGLDRTHGAAGHPDDRRGHTLYALRRTSVVSRRADRARRRGRRPADFFGGANGRADVPPPPYFWNSDCSCGIRRRSACCNCRWCGCCSCWCRYRSRWRGGRWHERRFRHARHASRCISRCCRFSRSAAPLRRCRKCTARRSMCRIG